MISVDKANVLEVSRLWRTVVDEVAPTRRSSLCSSFARLETEL